ncbi:hypothetical protein, partial [Rhodomicrobium vannielii]|uniref:hypothetical protein n=1 Tax=Rhodomicrobium vannielii TaxID=1069 RepID=UPI001AED0686
SKSSHEIPAKAGIQYAAAQVVGRKANFRVQDYWIPPSRDFDKDMRGAQPQCNSAPRTVLFLSSPPGET